MKAFLLLTLLCNLVRRTDAFLPTAAGSGFQAKAKTNSFRLKSSSSSSSANVEGSVDTDDNQPDDKKPEIQTFNFPVNELLEDAINQNSTAAATELLDTLKEFREQMNANVASQEHLLNGLLRNGPDARLPFWARSRRLAKYSRRARMYSLRRTLNLISPPSDRKDDDSEEVLLQRRRRALISLLRSLSSEEMEENDNDTPAIVVLEKKAKQASKDASKDLIARRPQDLETPDYEVVATAEEILGRSATTGPNIEIRQYKPYSVCSVNMNKPRPTDSTKTDAKLGAPELKGASSFGALAGYLFGKNKQSTAMKMTTPVFMTGLPEKSDEKGNDREMQFVLPSDYWGDDKLKSAPMPLEGSGVTLQNKDSETRAVLMFSGYASSKEAKKRTKQLFSALSRKDSKWNVVPGSESLAQYNDPFTPPWRRLNEVSVTVEQQQS